MDRLQLIQQLVEKNNYTKYLEIGVLRGDIFFQVNCKQKVAVDPDFQFNWKRKVKEIRKNFGNITNRYYEVTSDEFFEKKADAIYPNKDLEISLIDGMHEFKYVLNDVQNSLKYLAKNGVLVLHDCNPKSPEAACSFEQWRQRGFTGEWNGDTWKAITWLLQNRSDIEVFTIDTDHGLGIVTWAKQPRQIDPVSFETINAFNFNALDNNRQQLINLKSVEWAKEFFKNPLSH